MRPSSLKHADESEGQLSRVPQMGTFDALTSHCGCGGGRMRNGFQLYSCYSSTTDGSDMDDDDGHSTVLVE